MPRLRRTPAPAPASAGNGNGNGRKSDTADSRLRRLRLYGDVLAVAVPVVSLVPVIVGFRLSVVLWLMVLPWIAALWSVNRLTVARLHRNPSSTVVRGSRGVLAVIVGLVVACAMTFWWFNGAIEGKRTLAEQAGSAPAIANLQQDRQHNLDLLAKPLPVVAQDPEVILLGQKLDKATEELREAERLVICELDGTCGTEVPGVGEAYRSKVAYRDKCKRAVEDLSPQLDKAKETVTEQAGRLSADQAAARGRGVEIDKRLEALRSAVPGRPGRIPALVDFGNEHWAPVIVVSVSTFLLFFSFDCLILFFAVRRISRRTVGWRTPDAKSVKAQHEQDELRSLGAVPYDSLPPEMRDGPAPGSAGG